MWSAEIQLIRIVTYKGIKGSLVAVTDSSTHGFCTHINGDTYFTMNWAYLDNDTYVLRLTRVPPNSIVQSIRMDSNVKMESPSSIFDSYIVKFFDDKVELCQPDLPGNHNIEFNGFEDPRLFTYKETIYVIASFRGEFKKTTRHWQIIYEFQNPQEYWICPGLMQVEKNWSPFEKDGKLFCVYMITPHQIGEIRFSNDNTFTIKMLYNTTSRVILNSNMNHIGGGAPPIFVPELDSYMSIAHWKVNRDVSRNSLQYYNFAYIFEKTPPFSIKGFTAISAQTPCLIEFMTGIQMTDTEFIVSTGIDDSRSILCKFDRKKLCESFS